MKLSTLKADEARLKDTCATLSPSSFMCVHTMITVFSYCSKPRVIFLVQVHPIQCISCLFNEQNSIFDFLCHSPHGHRLSCCILFNSSLEREHASFFMGLSPLYIYCENDFHNIYQHHVPMKKGTRIIFISHLGNWGVKRVRLKSTTDCHPI